MFDNHPLTRRRFLQTASQVAVAASASAVAWGRDSVKDCPFKTRGVVVVVPDLETLDWPRLAAAAGLTTIGTHVTPSQVSAFLESAKGRYFLDQCADLGIEVEHELHAMGELLPRELFKKDPSMFRMNDRGERTPDANFCPHSTAALEVICEKGVSFTRVLRATTGRCFYWIDDGQPMCRCPKCRGLSDSDQALLMENRLVEAIQEVHPGATLAHLAYAKTLQPPTQVKPDPRVFLEFAPIHRLHDKPLAQRDAFYGPPETGLSHGQVLDALDANLEVFPAATAQALEYWLDVSRFSGWKREKTVKLPWHESVFRSDLNEYAKRGIRHVTSFAAWIDGEYVRRFGEPPLEAYGRGFFEWNG